jgi:hypothetical protein
MEMCMVRNLATSFILASTLVGALVAPSFAADDTFQKICFFPVRLVGAGVSSVIGVPEGAVKDGVKGAMMSTKWLSNKLGDQDGTYQTWAGAILAAPFGIVGGGAYGTFDGGWHGLKTGYEKPFSKDSFTFKEE